MTALQTYLAELTAIRSTGAAVPETSYYSALANLFNAVGKTMAWAIPSRGVLDCGSHVEQTQQARVCVG